MKQRWLGYAAFLALAGCLYFFENGAGTRIVLLCALTAPLFPAFRRALTRPDPAAGSAPRPRSAQLPDTAPEESPGDVRLYQPGDPVSRIHWKLSAKRDQLLVRDMEAEPADRPEERPGPSDGPAAGRTGKRGILCCLLILLAALLLLFIVPQARNGAGALLNRLFDRSEARNAYIYDRFPVPEGQETFLAAALTACALTALTGAALLSRSRVLLFLLLAAFAGFQVYFGLPFPAWVNVPVFSASFLLLLRGPFSVRFGAGALALVCAVSAGVMLFWPAPDTATEAASERARDWLSRRTGQAAVSLRELPEGENETRHVHTASLSEGGREARPGREYRLVSSGEEQVSRPHWVNYLKTALMFLLLLALVTVPFLPFALLNIRRRKALERRRMFSSEDVSLAFCSIFQQVIAWLDWAGRGAGNLPYTEWESTVARQFPADYAAQFAQCARLFEQAAYSSHPLSEEQRGLALSLLERTESYFLSEAGLADRLRLRYQECLWV